jgi:hypothetical protein
VWSVLIASLFYLAPIFARPIAHCVLLPSVTMVTGAVQVPYGAW